MKINLNNIPAEGLFLREEISAKKLDLETADVKFSGPIRVEAEVQRITNAVSIDLALDTTIDFICGRCLTEFEFRLKKNLRLNYQINQSDQTLDIDPDIREEIILDYPIKPLCKPDCHGLCPRCGKNLNEGGCSCGTT